MSQAMFARSLTFLLVAVAAGCSSKSRVGVSGTVELDGKPLETGTINFFAEGEHSPAGGSAITNGAFRLTLPPGLPPGSYRVCIAAPDDSAQAPSSATGGGASAMAPDGSNPQPHPQSKPQQKGLLPPHREKLPARYNTNTELRAVVAGKGKNILKFELTSSNP